MAGGSPSVTDDTYGDEHDVPPELLIPKILNMSLMDSADKYLTFLYDNFANAADRLKLNGQAEVTTNSNGEQVLRLTRAEGQVYGTAFNEERVSLKDERSFSTYFTFELSNGNGWADGIVFTVQNHSNSAGSKGGALGYGDIDKSVGIKFDTWKNDEHKDPSSNSIAILKNGVMSNPLKNKAVDSVNMDFKQGTTHVWIDYNGQTGVMEIRLSKNSTRPPEEELSYQFPANERLTQILGTEWVYVGFTAATGGANQIHDIKTWYFTNEFDPIDVETYQYRQAPTGYTIAPVALNDGTVRLTIEPVAHAADKSGVELVLEDIGDGGAAAVITPSTVTTDEEGKAVVIVSSPDGDALETTIRVTGPGGIATTADLTIPGRTEAPETDNIEAIVPDETVLVTGVPAGATVRIYDNEGMKAEQTGVTAGEVLFEHMDWMTAGQQIYVTFQVAPQAESERTPATTKERSLFDASIEVEVNESTDKVVVKNVPPDATIIIYDENGQIIGQGMNTSGETAPWLEIELDPPGVDAADKVYVAIQEPGKLESKPIEKEALPGSAEPDAAAMETDGTADQVTIGNVPVGATVIIYDENRNVIGRITNGDTTGDVTIEELGLDIDSPIIHVTIIEPGKAESEPVTITVTFAQSGAPDPEDIEANATENKVIVKNVPANTIVTVYDDKGDVVATGQNSSGSPAAVTMTADPRLAKGQELDVTFTEPRKTESVKAPATAFYDKSGQPDAERITVNATDNTVTVTGIQPGEEIRIYDGSGQILIGYGKNSENQAADVTITPDVPLAAGETVRITLTEPYHDESDSTAAVAMEQSGQLPAGNIRADATANTITFAGIPDGAEIIVYDDQGNPIASIINDKGAEADLVLELDPETIRLAHEQELRVTIREPGKLPGEPTEVLALEQTPVPNMDDVLDIDVQVVETENGAVMHGSVTIGHVPPGATVNIYDKDGNVLASMPYGGVTAGEITFTDLTFDSIFEVSITEPGKYESGRLTVDARVHTQDAVDEAVKDLNITYQPGDTWESITLPIYVVSVGKNNTSVSWTSSREDVITITEPDNGIIEALVTRKETDVSVILTARVSKNGTEKTRTFLVIVKADGLDKWTDPGYSRKVNVIGGANAEVTRQVDVSRIELSDGSRIDKAVFDEAAADDFVSNPNTQNSTATIYVDEVPGEEPSEFAVEIEGAALQRLADKGISVEVRTDYGNVRIENAQLRKMADNALDLYFRLVPVKEDEQQRQINEGVLSDADVRNEAGNRTVNIVGASLKVETNYRDYRTTLVLYFEKNGIQVPPANVDEFLDSLRVYIDHGSGDTELVKPAPVYEGGRPVGLAIEIDRFSTFTIVRLTNPSPDWLPEDNEEDTGNQDNPDNTDHPDAGLEQISGSSLNPDMQSIVLELDGDNYWVDPEGFHVTVRGGKADKDAEIAEVVAEGRFVTIRLKDPLPPGHRVIVSYSPKGAEASEGDGNSVQPRFMPFSALEFANFGYHGPYICGFEDGTFRADNPVSRAEIASMLTRNMEPAPAGTSAGISAGTSAGTSGEYTGLYPDVSIEHWAWTDIERLWEAGLMVGDPDGRFRPQDAVTRAEMAMIAARWLRLELPADAAQPQAFSDVTDDHWAAAAIFAVQREGIFKGFEDGTFRPEERLTRAQAVVIMNRLLGREPIRTAVSPSWSDIGASHWAFGDIEEATRGHRFIFDDDGNEVRAQPAE
jgi:hypothetical protein